jgi:hypothetical protein
MRIHGNDPRAPDRPLRSSAGGAAPGPHRGGGHPDGQARHYAHTARPPKGRTLSTSGHQPSLDKKHVQILSTWPSASRVRAIERGYRVLFTTAAGVIASLTRALTEGRLEEPLELHTVPRLLIFDEIGYLPIDRAGANRFFSSSADATNVGP